MYCLLSYRASCRALTALTQYLIAVRENCSVDYDFNTATRRVSKSGNILYLFFFLLYSGLSLFVSSNLSFLPSSLHSFKKNSFLCLCVTSLSFLSLSLFFFYFSLNSYSHLEVITTFDHLIRTFLLLIFPLLYRLSYLSF